MIFTLHGQKNVLKPNLKKYGFQIKDTFIRIERMSKISVSNSSFAFPASMHWQKNHFAWEATFLSTKKALYFLLSNCIY